MNPTHCIHNEILHQKPPTTETCSARELLHQKTFTPESFGTKTGLAPETSDTR